MKKLFFASILSALVFSFHGSASAVPITQADFSVTASVFDFTGAAVGDTVITGADLTVTGGIVNNFPSGTFADADGSLTFPAYTNSNAPYSDLRIDFNGLVSKVGMDVHLNGTAVTFSFFDINGSQLDFNRWEYAELQPTPTFIGLDFGANLVSYVIVGTPDRAGHDIYIDNITYEGYTPVPEAASLALLLAGLFGVRMGRKQ
ncbi:MAG: hypothetical protein OEZ39_03030 [Gammaproteobacteria bacterium]|nr:hypothetical protein [Gammaproteobacteria bacterium]MDH5650830.1 hypothetical protein [Gammaproteobacteria bacterium]